MMLIRDDLKSADDATVKLVVDEAEKRLIAQCSFADAQDQRGTSLVNAAAALAAAAVALAGGSFAALGKAAPLTIGGLVGTAGFTAAACMGLWALRSGGFHSCGFYPVDFLDDLRASRSLRHLQEDFALDFQIRLTDNKKALDLRGRRFDAAALVMVATPVVAAGAAYVFG